METVNQAVSRYWTRVAEGFDDRASHIRHHEMWKDVLERAFGTSQPRDMLDLGTGTGACAIIAAELGHRVTAVDASEGMLAVAKSAALEKGLAMNLVHSEIETAPLQPDSFDIVTIRNVLWTVVDPTQILVLAHRSLRTSGIIVVSDGEWGNSAKREDYDPEIVRKLPRHRGLSRRDGEKLLEEAGFEGVDTWEHLFTAHPYEAMGSPPFFFLTGRKP